MAEGELKAKALATIEAGRRELGAEAEWIRRTMSPRKVVERVAQEHSVALLACALVAGVAVPFIISWRKKGHDAVPRTRKSSHLHHGERPEAPGAAMYLAGLILKTAAPLLISGVLNLRRRREFFHADIPASNVGSDAGPSA